MKFHHVGIVCANIEEEILNISKIHVVIKQCRTVFDKEQNAELLQYNSVIVSALFLM